MRFAVEYVGRDGEYVFARQLELREFALGPGATLGGYPVWPHLTQPRALDETGALRTDLFAFSFTGPGRARAWEVGDVVVLLPGSEN
ncbi:MAG: hypothetical protein ACRBN8_40685 [Nannocystales bacterium]